ncbi:hypothetical protein Prede_1858 [Prevotella dentalis DSM 3688]|uniref:MacB-like periplasmic core domain-containing protein n=1 Tax=Prevotella dentalis (strain ATCC 49559 / DSM 3688 / JCM 13448 / NCTC 12043 / ES 2772) TaxID=908937 RepID=L0JFN7_PREDD|nr:hypothetical protein Prede_1858 [Prevotella dentalis DSM 3688]
MNYTNLFKIALRAILANKMRSFLTALGIIIGVASVITMLAIGQGSKRSIQANIAEMGSNMIMIHPGADMRGGVRQDASSMETLKLTDYQTLKDGCAYIKAISPVVSSSGQFIYGNNNTQSTIYGVNQEYLGIRQLSVSDGEVFTQQDIKSSAKVCILGKTVVDYLFPDGSDPIGRVIRFNSIPFRVIGVLKKKGYNSMGMDQDNLVLAPYTTVMKRILAQNYLSEIQASAITEDVTDKATEEMTAILRRNHKLKEATDEAAADADDFNHPLAGGALDDDEFHHQHDDYPAGLRGRHLAYRGWHRHHEHHVRQRYRAHPRDRTAHERGGARRRHPQPVPHRGHSAQCHGRHYRRGVGRGRQLRREAAGPLAHLHRAVDHRHELCRLHFHRCVLWLVPGQEGRPARSHRSHPL